MVTLLKSVRLLLETPEPAPGAAGGAAADSDNESPPAGGEPSARERYHVRIREIPSDERPRERLIQYGADVLSTAELLAILLRTGTEQRSAVGLAEHLLATFGSLRGVAHATIEEMAQVHGIGPAKAAQIKAAIEFGRRLVAAAPEERTKIRSPQDVYNLLGPSLREEKREHFIALLLDTKGGVLRTRTVSVGDLSSSLVHPREVFVEAVRHSAASLIVAHNHPSGDPTPSPEDAQVTRRLNEAGQLLGIDLLDHVVLGDNRWVSLKERGLM
jgi:DNA repair protein RadC